MASIPAGVAAYEPEVRAQRILAGQAAARMRGVRWGGSTRGRRITVTVEQIVAIRRMKSEGQEIAAIARGTGLSRPTIYRILGEQCKVSTASRHSKPFGKMNYGD
jgi:DNA invertase Pin-like site-specific DNA recombinase